MRKILVGLMCAVLVVGVANLGHAFLFFGSGGGGSHKSKASGPSLDAGSLFKNDFSQFGVKPDTGGPGSNNSGPEPLKPFLTLPDLGPNPGYAGSIFSHFDFDSNHNWTGDSDNHTNTPVPEASTMILLGIGLVGLAGYGRRMLKK